MTTTFDFPTPLSLAQHIAKQLEEQAGSPVVMSSAVVVEEMDASDEASLLDGKVNSTTQGAQQESPITLENVLDVIATVMGARPDADAPLMSAGLDSLGAVQLRTTLSSQYGGLDLPATLAMDYPTAQALTVFLQGLLMDERQQQYLMDGPAQSRVGAPRVSTYDGAESTVAEVVAVAAHYPQQDGIAAAQDNKGHGRYWKSAVQTADLQGPVPLSRWDIERHYSTDTAGR